jgi:hypothetical protein
MALQQELLVQLRMDELDATGRETARQRLLLGSPIRYRIAVRQRLGLALLRFGARLLVDGTMDRPVAIQ